MREALGMNSPTGIHQHLVKLAQKHVNEHDGPAYAVVAPGEGWLCETCDEDINLVNLACVEGATYVSNS